LLPHRMNWSKLPTPNAKNHRELTLYLNSDNS
jgi:hypothetical protein